MKVLDRKRATMLIAICCFAYSMAYVGRLCYGANLTAVIADFGITKSEGGSISSFFFFSYAAGQLLNTILAKYYNPKYVVFLALAVSAFCNLVMGTSDSIPLMQLIWLVNGLVQSTLWCSILNLQAKYLSRKDISRAIIWNCMTIAIGTFVSYGLSALLSALSVTWRAVFWIASVLIFSASLIWFFGVRHMENAAYLVDEEDVVPSSATPTASAPRLFTKYVLFVFSFACVSAALCAFIRDGIVTWLPTILKEDFGITGSLSIILTMILPEISLFGAVTVKQLLKKIKGHLFLESCFFVIVAVMLGAVIVLYPSRQTALTIALFALMYLCITCIINLTTSVIPFAVRQYNGAVGSVSAFLDACCYAGSICSTYLLGLIAETRGWMWVIYVVAGVAVAGIVVALIGSLLARRNETAKHIL